jgi:hypothetical protein
LLEISIYKVIKLAIGAGMTEPVAKPHQPPRTSVLAATTLARSEQQDRLSCALFFSRLVSSLKR